MVNPKVNRSRRPSIRTSTPIPDPHHDLDPAPPPMRLIVAHKILMVSFLGLCAILFVRGVRLFVTVRSTSDLVLGVASALVGVGLSFYVRRIWAK